MRDIKFHLWNFHEWKFVPLFVAECKWGSVSFSDLEKLRHRARLVHDEFQSVSELTLGLFSGRGDWDRDVLEAAEAGEVELFGPTEILSAR